jgi:hypothetical protein
VANSRPIDNPANLGLGETGCDSNGRWWARDWQGRVSLLTSSPGTMVRVIGGTNRVVVPSANNSGGGTSIQDAADLITNVTNFAGELSSADTNVQLALDTLDDHTHVHSTNTSLTADDHTQYALLLGRAGGQSLSGGTAANDDLTLQGTTHATRTTSYVLLQPNGGLVGIGTVLPTRGLLEVNGRIVAGGGSGGGDLLGIAGTGYSGGYQMWRDTTPSKAANIGMAVPGGSPSNDLIFSTFTPWIERMRITNTGNISIGGITTPTARLHLPAGTATASTAPLKLTSGVSLTNPEAGALEFTTDSLFFTITTGPTRKTIAFTDSDHGGLSGLTDDDHAQYALLNGRGPGQTLIGGTNAGVNMYLQATSNVTQGMIVTYDKLAVYADSPTAYFLAGGGGDLSLGYDGTDGVLNSSLVAASDINITCGANKTIELQNNVYRDINISGALLAGNPTVTPGEVEFLDEAGGATGIFTYGFAVDEGVHGCFELQHDYAEGTDLVFHVHWQGIAAPTGTDNVQWRLIYTIAKSGTTLDAATTIDSPDTAIDTQYKFYTTSVVTITGTNFNIADQFLFSLLRVASTGDAYAGDALIMTAGIHYQVNTLGSRNVTTK